MTYHCPSAARRPALQTRLARAVLLCLFALGTLPPALAQGKSATQADVAEKRGDLKELRGQIDSLRKEMASTEGKRASAADQLKDIEQGISTTQRELHQLGNQRQRLQHTLKELGA